MKPHTRIILLFVGVSMFAGASFSQEPQNEKKSNASQNQTSAPRQFGESYDTLRPEQKRLIDEYVGRYNTTTGSKITPPEAYNGARLSMRTTFDAVTHALLTTQLTDAQGKSLGRAIDFVDALDEVMGEEAGVKGDRQFRMYAYLKSTAFDTLSRSQEFKHDKDNAVYHKGFPICFRLKNGPPSIQVSMSRDRRMADIDVDYRSSSFPKALVNGHLTAGNSDVRAGNNLDTHDGRWEGLNGWWRQVFGFALGSGAKTSKEAETGRARAIPLNPRLKADQGIDQSAHDFLKTWVVDKQPNEAIAYFSRRSYACLEAIAIQKQKPVPPGMVRVRLSLAMQKFNENTGPSASVGDVFEAANNWSSELKEQKNAYPAEFRLMSVPADMAQDEECVSVPAEQAGKKTKDKFYDTVFRGKQGDSRNRVMSLLWTKEGSYFKIIAIRLEDSSDAGFTPGKSAAALPAEPEPMKIAGDPNALKDITDFYQSWIGKRDTARAASHVSERSYACLAAPSEDETKMTPADRIRGALERPLEKIPQAPNLSAMMSSLQPVDELVRPVEQANSSAFAVMAVPDQMAGSFLCQVRHLPEETPGLKPGDAKYGTYYLSASRFNYGEEESPALLLLWTKEKDEWKIIAWAVEVP